MIDRPTAGRIAAAFVAKLGIGGEGGPLVLQEDLTIERPFGWVFFYNFQKYLETKDKRFAAVGNAPIIVDRNDATVHGTGTARPVEVYLAEYEKRRAKQAPPEESGHSTP